MYRKMKTKVTFIHHLLFCSELLAILLYSNIINAQPGSNDPTFNPGTSANGDVSTTAIQADGKIIIGGDFTTYGGVNRTRIARLNTDGTLDATFNPGTGADAIVYTSAVQSNGKIIIGGDFSNYNGTGQKYIARLNTDGTLDGTFAIGTGTTGTIWTTLIQSNGKIIIGGNFTSYNGTARNNIARLNTDGTIDATFNPGSGANSYIRSVSVQSDGKIIIGGAFTLYNTVVRNYVARLLTNGGIDNTFLLSGGADNTIYSTAVQSDGKIIVGGVFSNFNSTASNHIASHTQITPVR